MQQINDVKSTVHAHLAGRLLECQFHHDLGAKVIGLDMASSLLQQVVCTALHNTQRLEHQLDSCLCSHKPSKCLLSVMPCWASCCSRTSACFIKRRAYAPASTLTSAQLPTPSATPAMRQHTMCRGWWHRSSPENLSRPSEQLT